MKLALLAFVAVSVAAAAIPAAAAKSSFTPPVGVDAMTAANCMVQNVGTQARTVTAVLRDQSGGEVQTESVEVLPGEVKTLVGDSANFFYCEFTRLTRTVRGYLHVYGASTELMLPAVK